MKKYWLGLLALVILGLITMPQSTSAFESRGNTSSAKWVSQSPGAATGGSTVIYANPGDILNFSLAIKNTSKTDVFYSAGQLADEPYPYMGAHELRVGATNDLVYANIFDLSYGGPFVNNNRFATFSSGPAVFPNNTLTFNWQLKVRPDITNGSYRYAVGVVQEYDAWLGDRPGPGAGGLNNNLGGRSGGTTFWDIVIGGQGYYQPPVNQSTLTNSYIGVSLSYPQSCLAYGGHILDDPTTSDGIIIAIKNSTDAAIAISRPYGNISGINDPYPGYLLSDWANEIWQLNYNHGNTQTALVSTTFADKAAYSFTGSNNIIWDSSGVNVNLAPGIYKLILTYNNSGQKVIAYYLFGHPESEQILSTISFLY